MVVMTVKYIRDLNKMQSKIYFNREKKYITIIKCLVQASLAFKVMIISESFLKFLKRVIKFLQNKEKL